MENPEESKGSENEPTATAPKPLPRKKLSQKAPIPLKRNKISKDEVKPVLMASDGRIPEEFVSQMASKMIDTVLHNYELSKDEVSAPISSTSTDRTGQKKSKASVPKIANSKVKENANDQSFQKLLKLADCLECQWEHNYHPCLHSNAKDNAKCKDEMKQKGIQYEEPKKRCLNKDNKPQGTAVVKVSISSDVNKKQPLSSHQLKQTNSKLPSTKSEKVAEDVNKPKATPLKLKQSQSTGSPSQPKAVAEEQVLPLSTDTLKPTADAAEQVLSLSTDTQKPTDASSMQNQLQSRVSLKSKTVPSKQSQRLSSGTLKPTTASSTENPSQSTSSLKPKAILPSKKLPLKQLTDTVQSTDAVKPTTAPSVRNPSQSTVSIKPKTPSKQTQPESADTLKERKAVPSKQLPSQSTVSLKPQTAPSIKSVKASPSSKKPVHVNFESENDQSSASVTQVKNKPSKAAVAVKSKVNQSTSRLAGNVTEDLMKRLTSKSAYMHKTVNAIKDERHTVSVPVSTRESRIRFNIREPSLSATHLPPMVISAHELKCKTIDPDTDACICQSAAPSKTKKKSKVDKKVNEVEELIALGKNTACEWHKNYHPCDKPNKKCDKTGDQQLCKLWKRGKSETDPLKSNKASCRSVTDPNSTLSTTPSEKAYIDKVVRTAVKLAKKNMNGNCKQPRRKQKGAFESGISSMTVTTTASSALDQMNRIVNNAICTAAKQIQPVKQIKKSKKIAVGPVESTVGQKK